MSEIKNKILEVSDGMFHKYGIRSVSMDDIAREISISKKTIYQSFSDKDDLVTQVCLQHIEKDKAGLMEVLNDSIHAVDELFRLSTCIRNQIKNINPSLLFDLQKFHPSAWQSWIAYKSDFIKNSIMKVITRGKEEGYFRESIDAEILSTYRVETIEMVFDDKIFPRDKFDFTEVQMMLFDHFSHGLMTVKGIEIYDSLIETNKIG